MKTRTTLALYYPTPANVYAEVQIEIKTKTREKPILGFSKKSAALILKMSLGCSNHEEFTFS